MIGSDIINKKYVLVLITIVILMMVGCNKNESYKSVEQLPVKEGESIYLTLDKALKLDDLSKINSIYGHRSADEDNYQEFIDKFGDKKRYIKIDEKDMPLTGDDERFNFYYDLYLDNGDVLFFYATSCNAKDKPFVEIIKSSGTVIMTNEPIDEGYGTVTKEVIGCYTLTDIDNMSETTIN